jgi:hypothetical protein
MRMLVSLAVVCFILFAVTDCSPGTRTKYRYEQVGGSGRCVALVHPFDDQNQAINRPHPEQPLKDKTACGVILR